MAKKQTGPKLTKKSLFLKKSAKRGGMKSGGRKVSSKGSSLRGKGRGR